MKTHKIERQNGEMERDEGDRRGGGSHGHRPSNRELDPLTGGRTGRQNSARVAAPVSTEDYLPARKSRQTTRFYRKLWTGVGGSVRLQQQCPWNVKNPAERDFRRSDVYH